MELQSVFHFFLLSRSFPSLGARRTRKETCNISRQKTWSRLQTKGNAKLSTSHVGIYRSVYRKWSDCAVKMTTTKILLHLHLSDFVKSLRYFLTVKATQIAKSHWCVIQTEYRWGISHFVRSHNWRSNSGKHCGKEKLKTYLSAKVGRYWVTCFSRVPNC